MDQTPMDAFDELLNSLEEPMPLSTFSQLQWLIWPLLALCGVLGIVALVSPRYFEKLAYRSSTWVDTSQLAAALDKTVDVDRHVLRYARLFGLAVLIASLVLAYCYYGILVFA